MLIGKSIFSQIEIEGDWFGFLNINNQRFKIVYHIQRENNHYVGKMDSPDQGAFGLNLSRVMLNKDSLLFDLSVFGIKYCSTHFFTDSINGTFFQGAFNQEMTLIKSAVPIGNAPKRPQEPKEPFHYTTTEVSFYNAKDNVTLSGTLSLPKKKGKFPAVILVSGSGPQNRNEELLNHKPFLVLADYLTRHGIAVLRYDDRGVGKSGGVFDGSTTSNFAYDAQAAFSYLKTLKKVNPKRIGIIGHSEGGMIAPMVACADSSVKFIVLLAGPGIPIDQLMLKQTEVSARFSGVSEEEIKVSLELNRKFYDILLHEPIDSLAKVKIEKIVQDHSNSMPSEIAEEIKKDLPQLTSTMLSPWFRYFINFNPEHYLRQINCPVLAINGIKDSQVSAIENLAGIRKSVKETNNKNVYTYLMPDLNHLMQHCNTGAVSEYIGIEETFSEEVMKIIADWIKDFELY